MQRRQANNTNYSQQKVKEQGARKGAEGKSENQSVN